LQTEIYQDFPSDRNHVRFLIFDCQKWIMSHYPVMVHKLIQKKGAGKQRATKKKPAPPRQQQARHVDFTISDGGIVARNPVPARVTTPPSPEFRSGTITDGGSVRAAKLLLALGPDHAAQILKELNESEVEKLIGEMVRIKQISADEKRRILDEFYESVENEEPFLKGGIGEVEQILRKGLGDERADELLSKLRRHNLKHDFEFLEQIDPPNLATALAEEHPQVSAVSLSFIQPGIAAAVIKLLPEAYRTEVAIRIAKTSRTHPEAVQSIAKVLREKFEKREGEVYSETGGAETLANILNHMDRGLEENLLQHLGEASPEILEQVREMLYTFEELKNLNQKEMRKLLSRINDDAILATALRGVSDDLRLHFFNSLSQNRASDVLEEMEHRGPLSLREINEARTFIIAAARKMDEEGSIIIKKEKEEFI